MRFIGGDKMGKEDRKFYSATLEGSKVVMDAYGRIYGGYYSHGWVISDFYGVETDLSGLSYRKQVVFDAIQLKFLEFFDEKARKLCVPGEFSIVYNDGYREYKDSALAGADTFFREKEKKWSEFLEWNKDEEEVRGGELVTGIKAIRRFREIQEIALAMELE